MTIPLPPYEAPFKPVPQITPFTYRDGITMLKKLENLQRYINRVLVPFVNENMEELGDAFETQVNALIAAVNAAIEIVLESGVEVQDPVVAAMIEDIESATHAALVTLIDSRIPAPPAPINTGRINVLDYGVVGDGTADDTTAINAAIVVAKAQNKTLWVPPGLTGVKLTSTVNMRYMDVLLESPIQIGHTAGPGIILGDDEHVARRRNISWYRVDNIIVETPTFPSIKFIGMKAAVVFFGGTDYLQLYADAAGTFDEDESIGYTTWIATGGPVETLEFLAVNSGTGGVNSWVNDNKFFGGRFTKEIRFRGNYNINGNKFYGATIEACFLNFEVGRDNHFIDVRGEYDPHVAFAAGTWSNIITSSFTSSEAVIRSGITVDFDLGTNNIVTSSLRKHMDAIEIIRFDAQTIIFDTACEYAGTALIPGFKNIRIRNTGTPFFDSGILPIEQIPSVTSSYEEGLVRLTRFFVSSDQTIIRPRVYCYDSNMKLLSPNSTMRINTTGGWVAHATDGYYQLNSAVAQARIILTDPNTKYLRIVLTSSVSGQPAFGYISLLGYAKSPNADSIIQAWRNGIRRPLYQTAVPTQGIAYIGQTISHATGYRLCTSRVDTFTTANAATSATTITVNSASGISSGDLIGVLLDDGTTHWTTVNGAPAGNVITLAVALPSAAASGTIVATNRWISVV